MSHSLESDSNLPYLVIGDDLDLAVQEDSDRVSLVIKADIRPGYEGEIDAKLVRLERALDATDS